jgi:DNA topoisomerase III
MTCVLGMVVKREREIRDFVKTPFYRVIGKFGYEGQNFDGEWRAVKGSKYFESHLLYKENGFNNKEDAAKLIEELKIIPPSVKAVVCKAEKKKEKKNPPSIQDSKVHE